MILDILIGVSIGYFAFFMLFAKFPHDLLPPVKRAQLARARRNEEQRMLDRIEREEEQARHEALRALRVDDVAFLSAGGHWEPPVEVAERLRQEAFLREEETREMQRAERRRELRQMTKTQLNEQIAAYTNLGIPFEELHVADSYEPFAVIATGPPGVARRETTAGGMITYYADGRIGMSRN